jgi:lysophospholipase L1-like esterase
VHRATHELLKSALYVGLPFAVAIGVLVLSVLGVVTIDRRIVPRSTLIVNLLLYWTLAAALLAALKNASAVWAYLSRRRLPLATALVSLVTSLIVAEYGARLILRGTEGFDFIPSETLHHRNPANSTLRDTTGALVRTNEDGLRTAWTRESFRALQDRIVVMGDSYTFGLGVGDDENVPYQLERTLRERLGRDDVGVLNAGTISYSPVIHRSAFQEVVREYRPTLTILLLDLGDIGDDYRYEQQLVPGLESATPRFDVNHHAFQPEAELALLKLAEPLLGHLRAPFQVMRRFWPPQKPATGYYSFEVDIDGVVETNRWFILRHPLEKTQPFFERSLSYVRELADRVRAAGSHFVLVVPPRYFQWSDRECPEDWAAHTRALDEPYEYAAFEYFDEAAQRVDFPIKSLLPEFQATTRFPLVLKDDAHWNPDGNRFVAEVIAEYLLEQDREFFAASPRASADASLKTPDGIPD